MSNAAGVDCPDAYARLQADVDAVVLDVRTKAEWDYLRHLNFTQIGKRAILREWQGFPDGTTTEPLRGAGA
jgi:rhodanese-related sulfurtransferase